jgi:hypothetical protein
MPGVNPSTPRPPTTAAPLKCRRPWACRMGWSIIYRPYGTKGHGTPRQLGLKSHGRDETRNGNEMNPPVRPRLKPRRPWACRMGGAIIAPSLRDWFAKIQDSFRWNKKRKLYGETGRDWRPVHLRDKTRFYNYEVFRMRPPVKLIWYRKCIP